MSNVVSKSEIIRQLADRIYGNETEEEILQCTQFCDTLEEIFTESLIDGKRVVWKGFISAEVVEHGERRGRNPKTDEVDVFPPYKSIKCKISQLIRDIINEK